MPLHDLSVIQNVKSHDTEQEKRTFEETSDEAALQIHFGTVEKTPTPLSTPVKRLCGVCGELVLTNYFFRHYKIHHKIDFRCTECKRFFDSQASLDEHIKSKHSRNHICNYCGKFYKQRSALNEHVRIKHEQSAKVSKCHICDKSFYRTGQLLNHLNTHYGRTPFECQKCKKFYHNQNSLQRHQAYCSEAPKNWPVCNRNFSSVATLQDHTDSEHAGKRHSCACGNSYKWRSGLARHKAECKHAT